MREKTTSSLFSKMHALTKEEQEQLISASYCHQYGVLFRLALFTGLDEGDILSLQWDDLDTENSRLYIRHRLTAENGKYRTIPKADSRFITAPSHIFKELADLYEAQQDTLVRYQLQSHSNSVAATLKGYQIVPWLMDHFFHQLLQFCNFPDYSISILRDTFALRAIEKGIKPDVLGLMLNDPNAGRTYESFYAALKQNWQAFHDFRTDKNK